MGRSCTFEKKCELCGGDINWIHHKNPYVDHGGPSCSNEDCKNYSDVDREANGFARSAARAEEMADRDARRGRTEDEE